MPDTLKADPKDGFIALPMSVFDLDLTPGAFRTLAELCRMANLEGQCWPSLRQLGERLNRSRASVSGYIAELRDADLIETETQKLSNGYNYRLRYCVLFWKEWRKQMGRPAERRVQPVERPLRTKNHNHINQSPTGVGYDSLILGWKKATGHAPYPLFEHWPSDALLMKTTQAIQSTPPPISADINQMISQFLNERGFEPLQISEAEKNQFEIAFQNGKDPNQFIRALNQAWKSHWTKPPTLLQLERLLAKVPQIDTQSTKAKLLSSYLRRWERHKQDLSLTAAAGKVAA